jgi:TolA-binding protein
VEVRTLRRENEALGARLDTVSGRVELLTARATRDTPEKTGDAPPPAAAPEVVVPPDLAVIRVEPPAVAPPPPRSAAPPRARRVAPPVPTAIPISEPDTARLDAIPRRQKRPIAAEADAELRAAREGDDISRAHALEDFTARYPRHPSADNALVEAAGAYAAAGRGEAACTLARRAVEEYPAGDAMSDALERIASCEARRGPEAERRVLERLVSDYPDTPAAQRAGARLSTITGSAGEISPRGVPTRSGP